MAGGRKPYCFTVAHGQPDRQQQLPIVARNGASGIRFRARSALTSRGLRDALELRSIIACRLMTAR
jgi:hypothetical protein